MSFPYNNNTIGNRIFKPIQNDAVERLRTSAPQSMIDTDFEYSLQPTKWETLELMNNIPSFFNKFEDILIPAESIIGLSATSTLNVTVSTVPANISLWPDPQPSYNGPIAAGWTREVHHIDESASNGTFYNSPIGFNININNVSINRVGFHGGGAIVFGTGNSLGYYSDYGENTNNVSGALTGRVMFLSAGSVIPNIDYGIAPPGNIFDASAVFKRQVSGGTNPLGPYYVSNTDNLTIINDGSLGGDDAGIYTSPFQVSLRRVYFRTLDAGQPNERKVYYVFCTGPGLTYWPNTTFNRTNRFLNYGKEPSRKVVEIYRNQPRVDITTISGTSGLDSWTEQPGGPVLNRNMFTQFGISYGVDVLYNEGNHSTTTSQLQGSAKRINYGAIKAGGGVLLRISNTATQTLSVGQPIFIDNSLESTVDGTGIVVGLSSNPSFTDYTIIPRKRFIPTSVRRNYATTLTNIYPAGIYTNSSIPFTSIVPISGTDSVMIRTPNPHNMYLGQPFFVVDPTKSDFDQFPWIGGFTVDTIKDTNSFTYKTNTAAFPEITTFTNLNTVKLYVRPEGIARHRYTDGGVQINSGNNTPYTQIIRQTRNYFRYQSGKSILFSTGLLFKPSYDVESFTVDASQYLNQQAPIINLTIKTEQPHGFALDSSYLEGPLIQTREFSVRSGINRYNDLFRVTGIVNEYIFTISIPVSSSFSSLYASPGYAAPSDFFPGGNPKVDVIEWNDVAVRSGMYDEQNGIYFECDGRRLKVGKRTSTLNLAGTVSVAADSNIVTGQGTKFLSQLQVNDYITIKGISFIVTGIISDTLLYISPKYSAQTNSGIKITKRIDEVVNQENFNLDKLDGTGPSGYTINLNKMQMIYFDYSWYGAGRIRWGVRSTDGSIVYCHEMPNNNVNTEAYMRSGNLPARFEIINLPQTGKLLQGNKINILASNTIANSAILVNVKKASTPQGPFFNMTPPVSARLLPFSNPAANTGFIYNFDGNGNNTGKIKPNNDFRSVAAIGAGATYSNFSKFGTGSVSLSMTPALQFSSNSTFKPGIRIYGNFYYTGAFNNSYMAGDFCIEGFFYFTDFRSSTYIHYPYANTATILDPILFGLFDYNYFSNRDVENYGLNVRAHRTSGSTTFIKASFGESVSSFSQALTSNTQCLSLNTWHHVALQRSNNTSKVFVDGVPVITKTNDISVYTFSGYNPINFGGYPYMYGSSGENFCNSMVLIDEIRGVFGATVYDPEGFSPPTSSLTTSTFTVSSFYLNHTIQKDIKETENDYYKVFTLPNNSIPYVREIPSIQTLVSTASTISVSPSATFMIPSSGRLLLGSEYIHYSKVATKPSGEQVLEIKNRNVGGLASPGDINLYTNNTYTNIFSINNNCSPALSHWGTSVIMDGLFTEDKSYLFTASMSAFAFPESTLIDVPLVSIRLAPAADYGLGSPLGIRNLINRSIITLNDIQIVTRQAVSITVKVNADSPLWAQSSKWLPAGNGSISQYMDHSLPSNVAPISGGVVVFGFLAGEQEVGRNQVTQYPISIIRNLGNSILGGDRVYPDGPDILTVFARPFTSSLSNRTLAKISWLEAQG